LFLCISYNGVMNYFLYTGDDTSTITDTALSISMLSVEKYQRYIDI